MVIDNSAILADLDPDQIAVVSAIRGPVCVIAGAGTGKTTVITNRIAYSIQQNLATLDEILAVTRNGFLKAGQIQERLHQEGIIDLREVRELDE